MPSALRYGAIHELECSWSRICESKSSLFTVLMKNDTAVMSGATYTDLATQHSNQPAHMPVFWAHYCTKCL